MILAQININSIRNKFDILSSYIKDNLDILVITETKLDASFPSRQFSLSGFSEPFRFDRTQHGGGLLVFIRENIPCKCLNINISFIEALFIELNLREKKWLLCCLYNPHKSMISKHLHELQLILDNLSSKYENFLIIGDFNAEPTEIEITNFCQIYNLVNLIKEATCFKNPEKPTCIDLMLTNKPKSFIKSIVVETGLSDFHKMTITIMKLFFTKQMPNIIKYRDYKKFSNQSFRNDLVLEISKLTSSASYNTSFQNGITKVFDNDAPVKTSTLRADQSPSLIKVLVKR